MLIEKEIETLRKIFANISSSQDGEKEDVRKLMLQQLGIIKTIVSIPTEANQHLLSRLMALNENKANALIDWQSIFQMIDLVYDGFYTQLNDRYSHILNDKEIKLCCLLKANFSTKEINTLTRQSLQTIYQRKTQIRQKNSPSPHGTGRGIIGIIQVTILTYDLLLFHSLRCRHLCDAVGYTCHWVGAKDYLYRLR